MDEELPLTVKGIQEKINEGVLKRGDDCFRELCYSID